MPDEGNAYLGGTAYHSPKPKLLKAAELLTAYVQISP